MRRPGAQQRQRRFGLSLAVTHRLASAAVEGSSTAPRLFSLLPRSAGATSSSRTPGREPTCGGGGGSPPSTPGPNVGPPSSVPPITPITGNGFCFQGASCWPSEADWAALNDQIGGRLITVSPAGAPCYTDPNSQACAGARRANNGDSFWLAAQPGAMQARWERPQAAALFQVPGCFFARLDCLRLHHVTGGCCAGEICVSADTPCLPGAHPLAHRSATGRWIRRRARRVSLEALRRAKSATLPLSPCVWLPSRTWPLLSPLRGSGGCELPCDPRATTFRGDQRRQALCSSGCTRIRASSSRTNSARVQARRGIWPLTERNTTALELLFAWKRPALLFARL